MRLLVSVILLLAACGHGSGGGGRTTPDAVRIPATVDRGSYSAAVRIYHQLDLDDPQRSRLRQRIVAYLAEQGRGDVETGDYDAVVARLASVIDLLSPEDLAEQRVPREVEPMARFLVERGSPRGDEARVLASLWLLHALHQDDEALERDYERLSGWGRDARAHLGSAFEGYDGLINVWEEHARLSPSPDILRTLTRLYVERRNSVADLFRAGERLIPSPEMMNAPMLVQRAPLDIAAVWLRHGDIARALNNVEAIGDGGQIEGRVIQLLRDARDAEGDGPEALIELGDTYFRLGRPEIALSICRLGNRRTPDDARFPLCLARLAAASGNHEDATAWYGEAIRIEPDERQLYDEAVEQLADLIGSRGNDDDPVRARALVRDAERILEARMRRFPDSEASVSRERFHYLIGVLEMSAGNADQARRRFEQSIEASENAEALLQLGLLSERTGDAESALRHYRRALDLTPQANRADGEQRAEILEHLGDAYRGARNASQAERMYREAIQLLEQATERREGEELAAIHVRRGVMYDRLGEHEHAVGAFQEAMGAAPDQSETYAQILSHLVVGAPPDAQLAHDVFRRAVRQLTLDPEWKVYFGLWVQVIAGRAGVPVEEDVRTVLEELADSEEWWGALARFGTGAMPYQTLLGSAEGLGEQTEAHFYEGARLLVAGQVDAARDLFRRVLETRMVSFFEFIMAQELLAAQVATPAPTNGAPPNAPR